jgi:hypothetical protein
MDTGFLLEHQAALRLALDYKITHGSQISYPLTAAENAAGHKGHSKMITVPMAGGHFRELDIV